MTRARRRRSRARLALPAPDAVRAHEARYMERFSARVRHAMSGDQDELLRLRLDQLADDDELRAQGLDWQSRRARGEV